MRDHRPTLANDLIAHSQFSEISKHAQQINQLNDLVKQTLSVGMRDFVRVANIRDGYLMLEVASASLKMKLGYERLNILNQLRSQGFSRLVSIEIKINPDIYRTSKQNDTAKSTSPPRQVSNVAADLLNMVAQGASPKVRKRLENIANLAKTPVIKNEK
jgi:hypothetical protein